MLSILKARIAHHISDLTLVHEATAPMRTKLLVSEAKQALDKRALKYLAAEAKLTAEERVALDTFWES